MAENNQPSLLMETCSAENNLVSIIRKFVEKVFLFATQKHSKRETFLSFNLKETCF